MDANIPGKHFIIKLMKNFSGCRNILDEHSYLWLDFCCNALTTKHINDDI